MRRLTMTPVQMVGLPWRWVGPTQQRDEHGNEWWELRIQELDDFFVAASSHAEAIAEAGAALTAFLASQENDGERLPMPSVFGPSGEVPAEYKARLIGEPQVAYSR